jgi:hypothetical protein
VTDELRVIQRERKITCAPVEWHTEFAGIDMPGGPRVTCTCGDSVQIVYYGAHVVSKLKPVKIEERATNYAQLTYDSVMASDDIRGEVYSREGGGVESFMVAGNGPTAYVVFVFKENEEERDLDYAFMHFSNGGESAVHLYSQWHAEDLYEAMKGYQG